MRSNTLWWLFALLLIISCEKDPSKLSHDDTLEEKLANKIASTTDSIDFEEFTSFDWESLIILMPYSLPDQVEETLRIDLSSIRHLGIEERDDINLIVFLQHNAPVKVIAFPRHKGDFADNDIEIIDKSEASFEVVLSDGKTAGGKPWIRLQKK